MKESLIGVEQTMLLPFWGRYSESVKPDGLIKDDICVKIVEENEFDFSGIHKHHHQLSRLAWIARAWDTDYELKRLVENEAEATIVCLGCGLDTAFYRCIHNNLYWYDIDLPNVMAWRKQLIAPHPRCHAIAGSILDASTFDNIEVKGRLVFLILSVFCYLKREEVMTVFSHMARFGKAAVLFDYYSKKGIDICNLIVLKDLPNARMIWYADTEDDVRTLHPSLDIQENYPLFQKIMPKLGVAEFSMAQQADAQRIDSIVVAEIG